MAQFHHAIALAIVSSSMAVRTIQSGHHSQQVGFPIGIPVYLIPGEAILRNRSVRQLEI